jgi:hypothetical protein
LTFKSLAKSFSPNSVRNSLTARTVAMIFSKRSTRTRVASETATKLLGGHPMFLGSQDIQLGVNETLEDTAKVVGSMVDGIMARVGEHSEIEVGGSAVWRTTTQPLHHHITTPLHHFAPHHYYLTSLTISPNLCCALVALEDLLISFLLRLARPSPNSPRHALGHPADSHFFRTSPSIPPSQSSTPFRSCTTRRRSWPTS